MIKSPLKTPEECRFLAGKCDRLGSEAVLSETRTVLLDLAARWRALAAEDEAQARTLPLSSATRETVHAEISGATG
jgi:hypothetical protein